MGERRLNLKSTYNSARYEVLEGLEERLYWRFDLPDLQGVFVHTGWRGSICRISFIVPGRDPIIEWRLDTTYALGATMSLLKGVPGVKGTVQYEEIEKYLRAVSNLYISDARQTLEYGVASSPQGLEHNFGKLWEQAQANQGVFLPVQFDADLRVVAPFSVDTDEYDQAKYVRHAGFVVRGGEFALVGVDLDAGFVVPVALNKYGLSGANEEVLRLFTNRMFQSGEARYYVGIVSKNTSSGMYAGCETERHDKLERIVNAFIDVNGLDFSVAQEIKQFLGDLNFH